MEQIQPQIDAIVEDEVFRGYRIRPLPEDVTKHLEAAHHIEPTVKTFDRIRFLKLTPRRRRLINEVVVARYHADLQNTALLSREQLRKLNEERGEWTAAMDQEMEELREQTNTMMRELYADGFDQRDAWSQELEASTKFITAAFAEAEMDDTERARVDGIFDRWLRYSLDARDRFTELYAKEQGKEQYSPDSDLQRLLDVAPNLETVEALQAVDDVRFKLRQYIELIDLRTQLVELQAKHTAIFTESVEGHRDSAEEMARIFFSCEIVDDDDNPQGKLADDFDGMWDLPDEVIHWLVVEAYFFFNGVPDEARDYLEQWGFIQAPERDSGSPEASDESLAEQSSKPDSTPVEEAPSSSSETTTDTISTSDS